MPWALYAEQLPNGNVRRYEPAPLIKGRIPAEAEYSADGCWATLYAEGKPVRTWMWLGLKKEVRRK